MKRSTQVIAALTLVTALAVGGLKITALRTSTPGADDAPSAAAASNVPLQRVQLGSLPELVHATGTVGAPSGSTAKVAFAEAGTLHELDVRIGSQVQAGEQLAVIDQRAFLIGQAQARADELSSGSAAFQSAELKRQAAAQQLARLKNAHGDAAGNGIAADAAFAAAEAKVRNDQTALARAQALFRGGVIAGKEVEAARTQLIIDRADARSSRAKAQAAGGDARAALRAAHIDLASAGADVMTLQATRAAVASRVAGAGLALDNAVLRAPFAGTVIAVTKHLGENVDPTTPVFEIGPTHEQEATLLLTSGDAQRVRVGAAAKVWLSGDPAGAVTAKLTAVVPARDPATQSTTAILTGLPAGARAGSTVEAAILIRNVRGMLLPASALIEDPQSGKTVVFVHMHPTQVNAAAFEMRTVQVQAVAGRDAVITGHIKPGELIAVQGAYELLAPTGG